MVTIYVFVALIMHPLRLHLVPAEGSVRQSSDKRAREHTTISIFNTLLEWDVELGPGFPQGVLVISYVCSPCKEEVEYVQSWKCNLNDGNKPVSLIVYKYFFRFLHSFCPYSIGISVIIISCFFWNSVIIPIQPNQFHSKKLFTSFAFRLRLVH